MTEPNSDNYTVKEILNLIIIPALNDIRNTATTRQDIMDERVSRLEAWRNKGIGAIALITALLVPVSIPVLITVIGGFLH